MPKRCNDDEFLDRPSPKRTRTTAVDNVDHISSLSDEVLLHVLSFLPIPSLLTCQSLSRRFHALAGDSEIWKRQYYSRWVRPRARRLANVRHATLPSPKTKYTPKVSTWLDHGHLAGEGVTNWKRQYRLRHNWSKGICRVTEVEFPPPPRLPMLVKFCAGLVFTADSDHGLRAWLASSPESCLASVSFPDSKTEASSAPTALTAACCAQQNLINIVVGFESGSFSVYNMDTTTSQLNLRFSRAGSTDGAITAMASSFPYLLMVSQHKVLSLYEVPSESEDLGRPKSTHGAHLLASLKADSILAPMSLSVRAARSEIICSVVYSFFHISCGWSLGIQELHFDKDGQQIESRLATTVDSQHGVNPLQPFTWPRRGYHSSLQDETGGDLYTGPTEPSILHQEPPTSISYSHPYLLTSHADNTLTVYLVVSTSADLFVKGGQRLWGHTSSVSTVQVSDRGKAISVSSRGDEIRIWELETLISSFGVQRTLKEETGIPISPGNKKGKKHEGLGLLSGISYRELDGPEFTSADMSHKLARMRGYVGFDDERVLLLREKEIGTQLLEFYDFT